MLRTTAAYLGTSGRRRPTAAGRAGAGTTNLDTYERIIESDVQKSAIAIAAAVYHLAMRDEMLPRFTREQMPAGRPPAATPTSSSGGDRQ